MFSLIKVSSDDLDPSWISSKAHTCLVTSNRNQTEVNERYVNLRFSYLTLLGLLDGCVVHQSRRPFSTVAFENFEIN